MYKMLLLVVQKHAFFPSCLLLIQTWRLSVTINFIVVNSLYLNCPLSALPSPPPFYFIVFDAITLNYSATA